MSDDSAVLIAQTAPSPTVRGPPPKSVGARVSAILATTFAPGGRTRVLDGALWTLVAVTARAAAAELALTRVSVFEAKLLTQTELPEGATAREGESLAGGATRIGGPAAFAERTSIRVTVPWTASPTNR